MTAHEADWVTDGAHGHEKHRALRAVDYHDPREDRPTRAECDRDEAAPGRVLPRCETTAEHAAQLERTGGAFCFRCGYVAEAVSS